MADYAEYFRDIRGYHVMNGLILSHIPIHEESLGRFGTNVHGHTHANRVMKDGAIDVRYHCVCVEQIDYTPILFEDVLKRIEAEGGHIGFRNGNGPTVS
jgi:calcineurin-like phosphoesterase family protein